VLDAPPSPSKPNPLTLNPKPPTTGVLRRRKMQEMQAQKGSSLPDAAAAAALISSAAARRTKHRERHRPDAARQLNTAVNLNKGQITITHTLNVAQQRSSAQRNTAAELGAAAAAALAKPSTAATCTGCGLNFLLQVCACGKRREQGCDAASVAAVATAAAVAAAAVAAAAIKWTQI
jgi:hypothetical protein